MKLRLIIPILVLSCLVSFLFADLQSNMTHLNGVAAEAYLQPFASIMGAQASNGWFHQPPPAKLFAFNVEFGVIQSYVSSQGDKDETFDRTGLFRFTVAQADELIPSEYGGAERDALILAIIQQDFQVHVVGPTLNGYEYSHAGLLSSEHPNVRVYFPGQEIQGNNDGVLINAFIPNSTIDLMVVGMQSQSLDFGATFQVPLKLQQVTVGTFAGTQCTLRGGTYQDNHVGQIESKGIGIQHNPRFWFPAKNPFDISLIWGYQNLKVGDITETYGMNSAVALSMTKGSKKLNFTIYMELAYVQSQMKVKYDYPIGLSSNGDMMSKKVDFTLDGVNATNFTIGTEMKFFILDLKLEGNVSNYSGNSMGVSLFHRF